MLVGRVNNPINTINVGKTIINNPPVITIFIGGMFTIPSHGWQKWHCFAHIIYICICRYVYVDIYIYIQLKSSFLLVKSHFQMSFPSEIPPASVSTAPPLPWPTNNEMPTEGSFR